MENTIITLKNIGKGFTQDYKHQLVLKDVNLEIGRGEFLCLVGPSGCGKSTILRILAGLDHDYTGEVRQSGQLNIGMVFQNFALFSWLTVEDNIGFGLKMRGVSSDEIQTKVSTEIKAMGLTEFARNHPKELSGGMRQRVGLARALVVSPDVLFMDEPFSALDAFTARELREDLLKVWHQRQMTIVLVTHLVEEAAELSDRIAVLSPRPGTVSKILDNPLPRPRDRRSAGFYQLSDELEKLIVQG